MKRLNILNEIALGIDRQLKKNAGNFVLPPNHQPGMIVPKGGSSCANCKYAEIRQDGPHCTNNYFVEWFGNSRLPVDDPSTYCSDWFESA